MTVRSDCHFGGRFMAEKERYEAYLRPAYEAAFKKPGTFLDIGSQYGFYTLLAKATIPDRLVFALEPCPPNYCCLVDTIESNRLEGVTALQCYADQAWSVAGLSNESDDCAMLDLKLKKHVGLPLDALEIQDVGCIKLDVEGFEERALRGLSATINRSKPHLIVELCERNLSYYGSSVRAVLALISQFGYSNFSLHDYVKPVFNTQSAEAVVEQALSVYGSDVHCLP